MADKTPIELWEQWIEAIAVDEATREPDLIAHLQTHVVDHIPPVDAHPAHWESWLAGTLNLVAILAIVKNADPSPELAISRLWEKWRQCPEYCTGPPPGTVLTMKQIVDNLKKIARHGTQTTKHSG